MWPRQSHTPVNSLSLLKISPTFFHLFFIEKLISLVRYCLPQIYATGYGSGGRLGVGGMATLTSPRFIETLQHVVVKKVAVHSGGKHCLALTSDGEVFSWGEGDDGKLGHGSRL